MNSKSSFPDRRRAMKKHVISGSFSIFSQQLRRLSDSPRSKLTQEVLKTQCLNASQILIFWNWDFSFVSLKINLLSMMIKYRILDLAISREFHIHTFAKAKKLALNSQQNLLTNASKTHQKKYDLIRLIPAVLGIKCVLLGRSTIIPDENPRKPNLPIPGKSPFSGQTMGTNTHWLTNANPAKTPSILRDSLLVSFLAIASRTYIPDSEISKY